MTKRVLMVTEGLARGGAERQMLALVSGLLDRGFQVQILEIFGVVAGQASFDEEFRALRILPASSLDIDRDPGDRRLARAISASLEPYAAILPAEREIMIAGLCAAVRKFDPDVVHCWSDLASVLGGFAAMRLDAPRIVLGQRTFPPPYFLPPAAADGFLKAYQALIEHAENAIMMNCSRQGAKAYEAWLANAAPIRVVYNGLLSSTLRFPAAVEVARHRAKMPIPEGAPVMGAIMRFDPAKDPELWLETAALVADAMPEAHFILAGYGHDDAASWLRRRGEELGLGPRLHMPGVVRDVGWLYAMLDVLLLTSRTETTPNVLMEAQASGIPVVSPDVGGISEVMLDGETGILAPDRSARGLAEAVLSILREPLWRTKARRRGPAFVAEKFGVDRMVEDIIAAYD